MAHWKETTPYIKNPMLCTGKEEQRAQISCQTDQFLNNGGEIVSLERKTPKEIIREMKIKKAAERAAKNHQKHRKITSPP